MFARIVAATVATCLGLLCGGTALLGASAEQPGQQSGQQPSTSQSVRPNTKDAGQMKWESLNCTVGQFTILMPAGSAYSKEEIYIPEANVLLTYHTYIGEADAYSAYLINFIEYPSIVDVSNPQDHFEGSLAGLQAGMPNGRILWMKKTSYQSYPAQDFVIQGDGGQIFGRMVMKGHTLYLLVGSFAEGEANPQQFNSFLNSFKISNITRS
jgi:hypothetical protein